MVINSLKPMLALLCTWFRYDIFDKSYNMIKLGSLIAAVSPFWITLMPTYLGAILFSVTLSVGEAIYSPKTYEYAMMVAPLGREGTYVGIFKSLLLL